MHTSTHTAAEEFNRSSKSVISTTPAWSEELLELLIELAMLEHTHTPMHIHTHTHAVTPINTCPGHNTCFCAAAIYRQVWCGAAGLTGQLNTTNGVFNCFTPCRLSFASQRSQPAQPLTMTLTATHSHTDTCSAADTLHY